MQSIDPNVKYELKDVGKLALHVYIGEAVLCESTPSGNVISFHLIKRNCEVWLPSLCGGGTYQA